jgi:hypothetical protein
LNGWWPQGGGPARVRDERWSVFVTYGIPEDVGRQFEVAAVVVNEQTNRDLQKWVEDTKPPYPPTKFPTPVKGCQPVTVIVKKTR